MASGTKYNTKEELLTEGIQALVYANDDNLTESDNIQKALKNVVESVWDKSAPIGFDNQTLIYRLNTISGEVELVTNDYFIQTKDGIVTLKNPNNLFSYKQFVILYGTTVGAVGLDLNLSSTVVGIPIPNNTVAKVRVEVVGIQSAGSAGVVGDSTTRVIQGGIKNISGTPIGLGAGLSVAEVNEDAALSGYSLTSNTIPGILKINVVGLVNKTIQWTAIAELTIRNI